MDVKEYGTCNVLQLDTKLPGKAAFAYVDTPDYKADRLFITHAVRVQFDRKGLSKEGSNYVIVFCKVRTRDVPKFKAALADLERKMLLEGHSDYPAFCEELFRGFCSIDEGR